MTDDAELRRERAGRLKERIYVTFTALAVVLAISSHGDVTAWQALVTLMIAVIGTLLAVLIADVLARMTVHERLLTRPELRDALAVVLGSLGAIALPVIFIVLSGLGVFSTDAALRASAIALVLALGVAGYLAVRPAQLPWWQRALALAAEAGLGLVVIGLELLLHG